MTLADNPNSTFGYDPNSEVFRNKIRNACWHAKQKFPQEVADVIIDYLDSWTQLGYIFGGGAKVNQVIKAIEEYAIDEKTAVDETKLRSTGQYANSSYPIAE